MPRTSNLAMENWEKGEVGVVGRGLADPGIDGVTGDGGSICWLFLNY